MSSSFSCLQVIFDSDRSVSPFFSSDACFLIIFLFSYTSSLCSCVVLISLPYCVFMWYRYFGAFLFRRWVIFFSFISPFWSVLSAVMFSMGILSSL